MRKKEQTTLAMPNQNLDWTGSIIGFFLIVGFLELLFLSEYRRIENKNIELYDGLQGCLAKSIKATDARLKQLDAEDAYDSKMKREIEYLHSVIREMQNTIYELEKQAPSE